jgi:hypothetical protein
MEILDLVEAEPGNSPLDKSEFMNLRRLRPRDRLANAQANSPSKYQPGIDNLLRGLVELLPKSDGIWPVDDRVKWLRLAAGIIDLGYVAGDGEHKTISIAVVKAEPGNP